MSVFSSINNLLISSNIQTITTWTQLGSHLNITALNILDASINSSGDIVAIGAQYSDNSSSVTVYAWNGSAWIQRGTDIYGEAVEDRSGFSVSINSAGDVVAIGAPYNDGNGSNSGHVRVYAWNGSAWIQRGADIDGEAANDLSGYSVSINSAGDVVAIGAPLNGESDPSVGHVRVYTWNGSSWIQRGDDIDGDEEQSGISVSLNSAGDVVAIGVPASNENGLRSGNTKVYNWNGSSWIQRGADITGEYTFDNSGGSVSINSVGDVVAIGARFNDGNGSNSGHVRVYAWNGSVWTQRGADIDGEAVEDRSGFSVSINSAGDVVAIGAPYNDGNGSNSGHVRVYFWNGSSWIQRGDDIDGEAAYDESGFSVSLNSTGNILAICATDYVRVYRYITNTTSTTTSTTTSSTTSTTTTTVAPITFTNYNISNGCDIVGLGSEFTTCGENCPEGEPFGSDINIVSSPGYFTFSINPIISNPQGETTFQWLAKSYGLNSNCSDESNQFTISNAQCWQNNGTTIRYNIQGCVTYYKIWCRVTNNGNVADSRPYYFRYDPIS